MGKPEFIVQMLSTDVLLIVECKAKISNHKSSSLDKFSEYAVDGAILYGKYLSKEFHVISVGVSGENEETLRISNYLWIKESFSPIALKVEKICSKQEYLSIIKGTNEKKEYDIKNIKKNTKAIHKTLREIIKITDELKPIIISAILLALSEKSFADSYNTATTPKSLLNLMLTSIRNKLESIESMPEFGIFKGYSLSRDIKQIILGWKWKVIFQDFMTKTEVKRLRWIIGEGGQESEMPLIWIFIGRGVWDELNL